MSDWRDFEAGRRGLSLAGLSDGESMGVFVDDSPYLNEEEIEQDDGGTETSESLRVPCIPVDVPDGYTDMSGDDVDTVDDPHDAGENAPQYHIINSSTAFKTAMRDAFPENVTPEAATVTITAHQPEGADQFGRSYSVDYE